MKLKLAFLLMLAAPLAHAEPWLCSNADGSKHFSYEPESAKKKNCVHHPIPSGNVWRARPKRDDDHAAFPRVDRNTQRERDIARREILERELAEEKRALAEAVRQLEIEKQASLKRGEPVRAEAALKPLQDRIRVHTTNIVNLEKELGGRS